MKSSSIAVPPHVPPLALHISAKVSSSLFSCTVMSTVPPVIMECFELVSRVSFSHFHIVCGYADNLFVLLLVKE